jgi:YceG-like family
MNDSDWRDPFADDEAARERAARRAERAARRREREQEARESLGDRVRDELAGERPADAPERPEDARPSARPADAPSPEAPADAPPPERTQEAPAAAPPAAEPSRPPRRRAATRAQIRHRRTLGLVGLGAVIVLVAGAGVVVSRSGDEDQAPAAPTSRKTVEVTIPEGLSRTETAPVAKDAGLKGNYEKATRSSRAINLKRYGAEDAPNLEGFLFPATYEVFKRDGVEGLVDKQLEEFQRNIKGVDLRNAKRIGLSVYEVVIIASMVEREIQVPEERELAASVIYNRLEAGNPLGIDATIRFEDQNWTEPLLESRLNEPTPYNTRINPGLPPGPIGNPGLASLEAAANPADTDFFYYVIKPGTCNEHTFVETEAEFQAASDEYQEALEAEGGSPTEC